MMKEGYSGTYQTKKSTYRYNYCTQQIEQLGNRIRVLPNNGDPYPVVETGVINCFPVSA